MNIDKKVEEEARKSKGFFAGLFDWKLSEEELRGQIENYDILGLWGSARGIATFLIVLAAVLTLIIMPQIWIGALFILVLAYFVYKGKPWAIILIMVYWTCGQLFNLGVSLSDGNSIGVVASIIFWVFFMKEFYQAYQVESERTSSSEVSKRTLTTNKEFYNFLRRNPRWSKINNKFLIELSDRFHSTDEVKNFIELTKTRNFKRDIIPLTLDSDKKRTGVDMLAFLLNDIGCSLAQNNRYNKAITALQLALRIYPSFTLSYGPLALAYYEKDNYKKALRYSNKWLKNPLAGPSDSKNYNPVISDRIKEMTQAQKAQLQEMKKRLFMVKSNCLIKLGGTKFKNTSGSNSQSNLEILKQNSKWSGVNKEFLEVLFNKFKTTEESKKFVEFIEDNNLLSDVQHISNIIRGKINFGLELISNSLFQSWSKLYYDKQLFDSPSNKLNEALSIMKLLLRINPKNSSAYAILALGFSTKGEYKKTKKYANYAIDAVKKPFALYEGVIHQPESTINQTINDMNQLKSMVEIESKLNTNKTNENPRTSP